MSMDKRVNLKLLGKHQEDLKIISTYIQDSIVTVGDMVFLEKNRIFLMIVNRFMWEDVEKGVFRQNKRIWCAVKFEEVIKVESKNVNQKSKNKLLECLAIKCSSIFDETYKMRIFFACNSIITIIAEAIEVTLHDLGKPWYVKRIPVHKI